MKFSVPNFRGDWIEPLYLHLAGPSGISSDEFANRTLLVLGISRHDWHRLIHHSLLQHVLNLAVHIRHFLCVYGTNFPPILQNAQSFPICGTGSDSGSMRRNASAT